MNQRFENAGAPGTTLEDQTLVMARPRVMVAACVGGVVAGAVGCIQRRRHLVFVGLVLCFGFLAALPVFR